jgi:peptide deformylase
MILPITAYGLPVLRQPGRDITPGEPGLQQLIADMWQTLKHAGGVGLAAQQVNQPLKLFIVEHPGLKQIFINARILEYSAAICTETEGCLSVPDVPAPIIRPESILIQYQDENFETHTCPFSGTDARIIQHEYDHTTGKLYLDHLSSLQRTLLRHKLQAISKGKFRPPYPMRYK